MAAFWKVHQIVPDLLLADLAVSGVSHLLGRLEVEFAGHGAASFGHALIRAGPAEAGHPVVAYHLDSRLAQGLDGVDEVLNLLIPPIQSQLHLLEAHGGALDTDDSQPRRFIVLFCLGNLFSLLLHRASQTHTGDDVSQSHLEHGRCQAARPGQLAKHDLPSA